ncbi:hypothetical protein [Thalassococcus sp. S3]|uniref:hypothetical protein n=1 Tax=Thalassococcus sp. S3 TaxID=2017482 RepID=UPI0010240E8E|nr:hypothetical protein [Thalassococcus sp. S3]QBF30988.1 hypothetical protein CFI11_07115 [Thalassococcus sp. S3]
MQDEADKPGLRPWQRFRVAETARDFGAAVRSCATAHLSDAQRAVILRECGVMSRRMTETERHLDEARAETDLLSQTFDLHVKAAQVLEDDLHNETDDGRVLQLKTSLSRLIGQLESIKPQVETARQADAAGLRWSADVRAALTDLQAQLGKEPEPEARPAGAGKTISLTAALSALSTALDAANDAARREDPALTATLALFPQRDPNLIRALDIVRDQADAVGGGLSARLEALKSAAATSPSKPGSNE